jgi:retron-type reverse transcriptase
MSLEIPDKVRELQNKLYRKAKSEPEFRFYLLYDKVHRSDILLRAWVLAKANNGAPGVDGKSFEDIETEGVMGWLNGLGKDLRDKTYKPRPVRRVLIPKPGGGERPLGIPTIRDRVAQTAAKLILEPIFEADMEPNAHAYRPGRSAADALQEVDKLLYKGYTDVVDADLSKFFDTIPHTELMQCVARRVVDKHMLHLVKMWLEVPVEETDEKGKRRLTGGKDVLERMGLTLNEKKTSIRNARKERFDFLGYTFGPHFSRRTGREYLGYSPSKKSVNKIREKVAEHLKPNNVKPWEEVRDQLNQKLRGWKEYFQLGSPWKAYEVLDEHVEERVRHFLRRRHKVQSQGTRQFSMKRIYGELGVFRLRGPLREASS